MKDDGSSIAIGLESVFVMKHRTAEITGFVLAGEDLQISLSQDPALEGVSSYVIDGTAQESLGFDGRMTYLDFQVRDVVDSRET